MLKKISVKNPGCQFCRYYLPTFEYQKVFSKPACCKGAQMMFQIDLDHNKSKKWKWNNCFLTEEKNKDKLCQDFKINSFFFSLFHKLTLLINRANQQLPPTFRSEKWWET